MESSRWPGDNTGVANVHVQFILAGKCAMNIEMYSLDDDLIAEICTDQSKASRSRIWVMAQHPLAQGLQTSMLLPDLTPLI